MDENEEFEFRARAERESAGAGQAPKYDKHAFDNGPIKIGKEGLGDSLRDVLRGTDWMTRNIAGAGSAVVNAAEGIKGLVGKTDADQVANQKIIAEEAPVGNIAGNVAMLAPTALVPGANTVTGAATIGAVSNALITPGDATERLKAAAAGGVGGAAGAKASQLLSRAAPAAVSPNVRLLADEGIGLTPGQNAGGWLKSMEDKATSIPLVGDVINSARRRGLTEFNAAAIERAKLPGMQVEGVGSGAVQDLRQGLGAAYDDVLSRSSANALDTDFVNKMASLRSMVASLPAKEQKAFDAIIDREIGQRMAPNGMINAENLQAVKSSLGNEAKNFATSTDAYQRQLGQALKQADQEFRDLVTRANPQNATELAAIDKAYANFKRIQRAAAGVGAEDGVFTPAQLLSAAKAMDKTKDKRAFSEGSAMLQDLAAAGKKVMPSKVPDSGTAGRLLGNMTTPNGLLSTLLGAGAAIPLSAAYSKTGSRVINSAVNKGAIPIRNVLQRLLADNPNISRNVGSATLAELVRN